MARQRRGSLSYHRLGSLSYHRFYSMTGICASFYLLRRTLRTGADFSAFGAFTLAAFSGAASLVEPLSFRALLLAAFFAALLSTATRIRLIPE